MNSAAQASGQHAIVPFWNRVPAFFFFPLHVPVLGKMILFAALPALGAFATGMMSMIVAVVGLSLLAWIAFLRLGSRVLSETSFGHLSPERYGAFGDESLATMPFKIFALFMASGSFVGFITGLWGGNVGIVANFLVSLAIPAALIVLVVSRSLFSGLNPAASLSVIGAIGKPYLLLCLFLFSLSTAQAFLTGELMMAAFKGLAAKWTAAQSQVDGEAASEFWEAFNNELLKMRPRIAGMLCVIEFVGMYFTMIAFNMLGYTAYQYHEKLGLEVDEPHSPGRAGSAPQADPESKQIADLVAAGQIDKALDIAYEAQRLDVENLPANERYHKLLHLAGKDDRLLAHTNRLIPLMLRMGRRSGALEVLRRTREKLPAYRPESPEHLLALAEAARSERLGKLAFELLDGFETRHPRSALLPDALLLSGRILCEDLRDDARADEIFKRLVEQYADHPAAMEAARFREVLARMAAPANRG